MNVITKREEEMYTKEAKRVSKRPSYADIYKLAEFCKANREDVEAGKYAASELAALATTELKGFAYTDHQVRQACRMAGVTFKPKWVRAGTGSSSHNKDRRTIRSVMDRCKTLESQVATLESQVANLMQQLGLVNTGR